MSSNLLLLWSKEPSVSVMIWLFLTVVTLYAARRPAHELILSISRIIHHAMRIAARSIMSAETRMAARNREILLAAGEEALEKTIEREFQRVGKLIGKDLSGYPSLQQALKTQIDKIEEDYARSADSPPSPPGWVDAVETIAKIPAMGEGAVSEMLGTINKSVDKQYKNILSEYRKGYAERHSLLKKMLPVWRDVSTKMNEVDKTISGILERGKVIDSKMDMYEEIRNRTDKAVRTLSSSSLTQFFIAGFVLCIAIAGAVINFNLIALPMSEMVGGGSYIGPFKTSNVAAMVIILVEAAMGLFLMESLHITRLFPIIGSMDDRMRRKMMWITFSILFILAGIESSLAYMRDMIAADMQALRQSLAAGEVVVEHTGNWIPTAGQMVMGFILPFALAFVAIPMESFVHSSRTVLGVITAGILKVLAFLFRLLGNIAKSAADLIVRIYDLLIFAPLWIENTVRNNRAEKGDSDAVEEGEAA